MNSVILLLGSNLGNKANYLQEAISFLDKTEGITVKQISSIFESEAVGYESSNTYYNVAIEIVSSFLPQQLLRVCQTVENDLDRKRNLTQRYSDRTIDIDIILIENLIINETNLIVPHPRMHERLFCLKPVNEIASNWVIPTSKKTIKEVLKEVEKTSNVKKVNVKV